MAAVVSLAVAGAVLVGCSANRGRSADDVHAALLRKLPTRLEDREGWARDVQTAFSALRLAPSDSNLCAVLAVVEQESTYRADPPVPGLGRIAVAEIKRRAAARHVPAFAVDAALGLASPDGRTYAQRIAVLQTERQLSELYEEMIARLPLGSGRMLASLNPVRTAGPMQVSIDFAERHARGYPYTPTGSMRHEVFTRRGGLYFGIEHLLDYPAAYDRPLYRFADFNAGRYASRNAAFQAAAAIASGTRLERDGDLLAPGAPMDRPGDTEAALRRIAAQLGMEAASIRKAVGTGHAASFEELPLYGRVFAIADAAGAGKPVPRARVPEIALSSPKITRNLTTAWFASRVDSRWKDCMAR